MSRTHSLGISVCTRGGALILRFSAGSESATRGATMFWVVYRGLGLWVTIIPVVCLLVVFVAEAALVVGPTHLFDDRQGGVLEGVDWYLPTAVSFFLAGAICFLWGLRVNRPLPIDPYTKMPGPPPNHSLYFVKMQYWGF